MSETKVLIGEIAANMIIEENLSFGELAKKLNITRQCLTSRMMTLHDKNPELYERAREVSAFRCQQLRDEKITKNKATVEEMINIMKWIMDNKKFMKDAAAEFNIKIKTLRSRIEKIKQVDEGFYNKFIEYLEYNWKHKSCKDEDDSVKVVHSILELFPVDQDAVRNIHKIKVFMENAEIGDRMYFFNVVSKLVMLKDGTLRTYRVREKTEGTITAVYKNYIKIDGETVYFNDCIKLKKTKRKVLVTV